jgi:diphthamide biosynthesis protein 7
MYKGCALLRATPGCWDGLVIAEEYAGHGSIAYGADWYRGGGASSGVGGRAMLCATCSFYDRALHVWRPATSAAVVI